MISLNLTTGDRHDVSHLAEVYDTPLFITGQIVVCEVVFWSQRFNEWIVLVRERTNRTFDAGTREVSADELDWYADVIG